MNYSRFIYLIITFLLVLLGLASRRYAFSLPLWVLEYAGDIIWAAMVYMGIRFLSPSSGCGKAAIAALLFSYLIEFSQIYQAPWISHLRANSFFALILGQGFLWSDLICYTIGIVVVFCVDKVFSCTFAKSSRIKQYE